MLSIRVRRRAIAGIVAIGAACFPLSGTASATISATRTPTGHAMRLGPGRRVIWSALPRTVVPTRPAYPRPRLSLPATSIPSQPSAARKAGVVALPATNPKILGSAASANLPEVLTQIPGMTRAAQVAQFGLYQAIEPPDTQVAAGPDQVVEFVNSTGTIFTKSGSILSEVDLNVFFGVQAGYYFTDPKIVYDPLSARWFGIGLGAGVSSGSQAYVAVSSSSDALGAWTVYSTATSPELFDQPKIGVTTDKLVVSWNQYVNLTFVGEQTQVLQKTDLLAGVAPTVWIYALDNLRFNLVPAPVSSSSTAYLVYNGDSLRGSPYAGAYIGVVALSGTPAAANVAWTENDPAIVATSWPPTASQPGAAPTLDTGDDRFGSASLGDGGLWVAGNDGCIPAGDAVVRSCLRMIRVSVAGAPAVVQDFDDGSLGGDVFYPAVASDTRGNVYTVFSGSSTTSYAGVYATVQSSGNSGSLAVTAIQSGSGIYNAGACQDPRNRWGDYSGAAQDPKNPSDIWMAGEYAASATDQCNWGTAIARLTQAPPSITSIAPTSGPTTGATNVIVMGSDFLAGQTTVNFGQTPSGNVTVQSPEQLSAVTPAGTAGTVGVSVVTAAGQSNAGQFTYLSMPPTATFDVGSLYFGNQYVGSSSAPEFVTLTNYGPGDLRVASAALGYSADFVTRSDTCSGSTVPLHGTCAVGIVFGPQATGTRSATLTVADNSSNGPHSIPLTGNGTFGGQFHPLAPARIYDTRNGAGALGPSSSRIVQVTGQGGVPEGATAVVLNATVTDTTAASYLTVYPSGGTPPTASNLNWTKGETVPNLVEVGLSTNGQVSLFNAAGSTDVILDVSGYVAAAVPKAGPDGFFNPLPPSRVLDTRNGIGSRVSHLSGGGQIDVQITGQGGVPAGGVAAVVLNVTVTNTTAPSYLTVFPTAGTPPLVSNLNFTGGQTVPNRVVVKVGAGGQVSFFNAAGNADVVADVGGWFSDASAGGTGAGFNPLPPTRVLDTRNGIGGFNGLLGQAPIALALAQVAGIPAMSSATPPTAVVLNVTVADPNAPSYLSLWPSGAAQPTASDLNFVPGQTVPNLVVVKVGADGKVSIFNAAGGTHVIVDVVGWYS